MNEVATVEYNVIKNIETMTPEQLRSEINALYHQTEAVGNIAVMMMAETGRMLLAVKDKVKHGEFETWCDENLDFSKSKAERMMRLAEKTADENSIFSKASMLTDLSISKVLTLIAAPEEVAAEVIESGDAEDMTVRELQEQVKTLKEENEQISAALDEAKSKGASEKELENLKKKLEYEKGQNTLLKEKNEKEIEKAVEKAKKEAEKTVKEEVAKATADMKDEIEELQDKNTRLEMWSNEDLTEFRVQTKVMQEVCNDCMTVIARVSAKDKDKALKMAEGLKTILATKIESVNGLLS